MPRKPRKYIIAPNTLYHIVTKGNNQRKIFRNSRDYKKFLQILKETKKQYPFYLYSLNLIPNHYHLEIETQDVPISQIMHQINNTYAKYFRKRYGGSGHLFQERYFCAVVDKQLYFWELAAYIDLNAVMAGLVENLEDWPWSSYSIYCQKEYDEGLMDRDRFLRYWGEDLEKARLAYLKFIQESLRMRRKPPFPLDEKMI